MRKRPVRGRGDATTPVPYHGPVEDLTARQPASASRHFAVRPRDAWFLVIAAAVVALDQLSKWVIRTQIEYGTAIWDIGIFRLVHITNSGAAFGMLQGAGMLLAITSIVGAAAIVVFLYLLHAMRDEKLSPSKLVASREWRLFLMRPSDVEHELLRLHQYRKLEYQVAGSLVQLSLPCASTCEYAERMVA